MPKNITQKIIIPKGTIRDDEDILIEIPFEFGTHPLVVAKDPENENKLNIEKSVNNNGNTSKRSLKESYDIQHTNDVLSNSHITDAPRFDDVVYSQFSYRSSTVPNLRDIEIAERNSKRDFVLESKNMVTRGSQMSTYLRSGNNPQESKGDLYGKPKRDKCLSVHSGCKTFNPNHNIPIQCSKSENTKKISTEFDLEQEPKSKNNLCLKLSEPKTNKLKHEKTVQVKIDRGQRDVNLLSQNQIKEPRSSPTFKSNSIPMCLYNNGPTDLGKKCLQCNKSQSDIAYISKEKTTDTNSYNMIKPMVTKSLSKNTITCSDKCPEFEKMPMKISHSTSKEKTTDTNSYNMIKPMVTKSLSKNTITCSDKCPEFEKMPMKISHSTSKQENKINSSTCFFENGPSNLDRKFLNSDKSQNNSASFTKEITNGINSCSSIKSNVISNPFPNYTKKCSDKYPEFEKMPTKISHSTPKQKNTTSSCSVCPPVNLSIPLSTNISTDLNNMRVNDQNSLCKMKRTSSCNIDEIYIKQLKRQFQEAKRKLDDAVMLASMTLSQFSRSSEKMRGSCQIIGHTLNNQEHISASRKSSLIKKPKEIQEPFSTSSSSAGFSAKNVNLTTNTYFPKENNFAQTERMNLSNNASIRPSNIQMHNQQSNKSITENCSKNCVVKKSNSIRFVKEPTFSFNEYDDAF